LTKKRNLQKNDKKYNSNIPRTCLYAPQWQRSSRKMHNIDTRRQKMLVADIRRYTSLTWACRPLQAIITAFSSLSKVSLLFYSFLLSAFSSSNRTLPLTPKSLCPSSHQSSHTTSPKNRKSRENPDKSLNLYLI
jgi:hypothetical protein